MNAISLAQHSTAGVCPCLPRQSLVNTILTVAMTAAVPVVFVSVVASRLRVAWHNEQNVPTGHKWPLDSCLRDSDASDRAGRQIN